MSAVARLSQDGKRVILSKGLWSETFPVEKLASRIVFYRSLAVQTREKMRLRGVTGGCAHDVTLAALEAVQRQVQAGVSG